MGLSATQVLVIFFQFLFLKNEINSNPESPPFIYIFIYHYRIKGHCRLVVSFPLHPRPEGPGYKIPGVHEPVHAQRHTLLFARVQGGSGFVDALLEAFLSHCLIGWKGK